MAQNQTEIHQILAKQADSADLLLQVLKRESLAVVEGDVSALGELMLVKQEHCADLGALKSQMNNWLQDQELELWVKQQSETVQSQWTSLLSCLQQCQTQNDANGLLIERRQIEIELKLKPADGGTYGALGQNVSQASSILRVSV